MKRFFAVGLASALGVLCLVQPWANAQKSERDDAAKPASTAAAPLKPGPNDARIANVTAQLLERHHYTQKPFDDDISSKLLDRYIRDLDFQRLHFLQTDLDDLEAYRERLDDLILKRGDTSPAYVIFSVFFKRLEQHVDYVLELLKTEQFTFDTDERVAMNRRDQPFPKDMEEARKLWRDRLRSEYLQEKLNQSNPDEVAVALLELLKQKPEAEILSSIRDSQAKIAAAKLKESAAATNDVPESVETHFPNEVTIALKGKLSEDRAQKIAEFIEPMLTKDKAEAIAEAVAAKLAADNTEEILTTLTKRYQRVLKTFKDWDSDNVLEVYLSSLARVYDPHSDYLGKSQLDSFKISMNLALFGIGAELRSEDGYCKISKLLPGPAAKSKKVRVGDRIVAVSQGNGPAVDIVDMPLQKAVQLIRGPKGSEVRLTLIPTGADSSARKTVALIRDEIKLEDQEAKGKIIELPSPDGKGELRLGVIDLPSFYAPMNVGSQGDRASARWTSVDVAKLLKKFQEENVAGVILDLRHNGGGSLDEAVKLTGLFIKDGPVVEVRDYDGRVEVYEDKDSSVVYDGPLVVLTSKFSASASEIAAGALQDYGRAVIVGDASTHGKGTVQSVNSLEPFVRTGSGENRADPGAVKLTIRKFYRASGGSTQLKGITPDIVLPSVWNESKDIGEAALENSLEWDTVPAAEFEAVNRVQAYLEELRKRDSERIATNKDFAYIREDIEEVRKFQEDKTVSLNEKTRLSEKAESEARRKEREKELLNRTPQERKVYEISVKLADQPGLPPPVAKTNRLAAATSPDNGKAESTSAAGQSDDATNNVHESVATGTGHDTPEEAADEKVPQLDTALLEAERILVDYLSLLPEKSVVPTLDPVAKVENKADKASLSSGTVESQ